jgi:hypothetical protein
MTVFYSDTMALLRNTVPQSLPDVGQVHGRVRIFNSIVTLAAQTTSDTIEVAKLPKGARVLYGMLTTSVSLGTSTVAVGITGTTGKYRAAAVFTATDTPTAFGVATVLGVKLAAEEIVFLTIAVATLPGSGTLLVSFFYTVD